MQAWCIGYWVDVWIETCIQESKHLLCFSFTSEKGEGIKTDG